MNVGAMASSAELGLLYVLPKTTKPRAYGVTGNELATGFTTARDTTTALEEYHLLRHTCLEAFVKGPSYC